MSSYHVHADDMHWMTPSTERDELELGERVSDALNLCGDDPIMIWGRYLLGQRD